jgi:hypothetical protein
MGRAQSDIALTPQLRLGHSGGYASEDPGTVATAARRIVLTSETSEGGGRPSRQSCPERLAYNQFSFMLPLEVMAQVTASQRC